MEKTPVNIAVIGSSGAIGQAFVRLFSELYPQAHIHSFSRSGQLPIDYQSEESLARAAEVASEKGALDVVIMAGGLLHQDGIMPEKSLRHLSAEKFHLFMEANTIAPALVAKHFVPYLNKDTPSVFAALSARVGSISDNRLGGWYSYRASKAALNMIIKNIALEIYRRNKKAVIVGLHPGTVDSKLSGPLSTSCTPRQAF